MNGGGRELPAWLWLWLPPCVIAATYAAAIVDPVFHRRWFSSEEGFLEWVTVILLVPAIGYGACCWRSRGRLRLPWVARWWLALTLVCIYFAGEEISWGQKIFHWETPTFIGALNDQNETNLHNISSWFDQKPRLAFELWVLTAGVLIPARRAMQGVTYTPTQWQGWFWPTGVCVPTAVLALASMVPERIKDLFGLPPFPVEVRYSELQEFYFSLFLFLYLASAWRRLRAAGR
jgi:hypothetical protein